MYHSASKILPLEQALRRIAGLRFLGRKIVFTNGCFDLLHVGHVTYLEAARRLGDFLVLGLNSDASVKGLKGESRPIVPEMPRAKLMAALEMVDMVILFEEETPIRLISAILPDVLVKGGDYQVEEIVGYQEVKANGGEIVTIPIVEGFSSSNIIQNIQQTL